VRIRRFGTRLDEQQRHLERPASWRDELRQRLLQHTAEQIR
jgi:hypothetical protein